METQENQTISPHWGKFLGDVAICALGAYGGPEAHYGVFIDQLVIKRRYLAEEEMTELIGLTGILPGPSSTQTIIAIGYKVGGPLLALLTFLVWALPALIAMTALSFVYTRRVRQPDEVQPRFLRAGEYVYRKTGFEEDALYCFARVGDVAQRGGCKHVHALDAEVFQYRLKALEHATGFLDAVARQRAVFDIGGEACGVFFVDQQLCRAVLRFVNRETNGVCPYVNKSVYQVYVRLIVFISVIRRIKNTA